MLQFFKKKPVDLLNGSVSAMAPCRRIPQAEMREQVKKHISRGNTIIAAEIATIGGLDGEFSDLIADVDGIGAAMREKATDATA